MYKNVNKRQVARAWQPPCPPLNVKPAGDGRGCGQGWLVTADVRAARFPGATVCRLAAAGAWWCAARASHQLSITPAEHHTWRASLCPGIALAGNRSGPASRRPGQCLASAGMIGDQAPERIIPRVFRWWLRSMAQPISTGAISSRLDGSGTPLIDDVADTP